MKERESFASRLGFVLISAGCAIGLGNVWRFPYITGKYGGAAFVLIYLLFLLILHFLVVRFLPSMAFYSLVFCLGASTHLFFDMFNSPGVPLFWPVKIRVRIAKIRTESQFNSKAANLPEKMFRGVVCVLDVLLAVNMAVVLNGGFPAI